MMERVDRSSILAEGTFSHRLLVDALALLLGGILDLRFQLTRFV